MDEAAIYTGAKPNTASVHQTSWIGISRAHAEIKNSISGYIANASNRNSGFGKGEAEIEFVKHFYTSTIRLLRQRW